MYNTEFVQKISVQHKDIKKNPQGQLKRSWITELYLEHHAISLKNRLTDTFFCMLTLVGWALSISEKNTSSYLYTLIAGYNGYQLINLFHPQL